MGANLPAPGPAAAVDLLERGLAVFPLPSGSKVARQGWQHTVTRDPERIRASWPAGANVGIGCRASGIVGIDLDRHTTGGANAGIDGVEVFAALCARWGQPRPVTLEVRTPNDGRHLLLRVPPGLIVPSVSGGTSRLGPGIDIRAPGRTLGGYLAGPGSVVGGRAYEIEVDAPIAQLPGWLAALLAPRTPSRKTDSP
ncbi:bifunctional DNA primase/polymerase [Saccharopolyspora taberi]|uniref:DNA primase/polymerase bifunctional N-terminal domain-containing protein n=1 Tax=Saccharopolyspora taberi TaxID=60895 RepID=A0ABN3VF19_9PSEU